MIRPHLHHVTTLILMTFLTSSLPAVDDAPAGHRPASVQAAFEAMEAQDAANLSHRPEGHMGRRIPVLKAISFFQERIAERPGDVRSMTVVGRLYIRMAKETGQHSAYATAEKCLRDALSTAPDDNAAKTWLAVALQAQHRFREALQIASDSYAGNSQDTMALATIGDCQFHLGRVEAARSTYQTLSRLAGDSPPVLARHAQLAEVNGSSEEAITLLENARDAVRHSGQSGDAVAWYELRLAALHHKLGHADKARVHYRTSLKQDADLHVAKTGLARLLAEQGDFEQASDLLQEVIDTNSSAAAMMTLGDVLTHQGHTGKASNWYDRAEAVLVKEIQTTGTAHQRDLSRFYSDRNRNAAAALSLARQDLQVRSDVYAHDTLAWALHRNGQHTEAASVMQRAIQLGTQDPMLHYHAGMIYASRGQPGQAAAELRKALQLNPQFDLLAADIARQTLAAMELSATTKL
ncbi:MAG: tetratricopeptide repeat protein [Planctomycetaceae bacterium]